MKSSNPYTLKMLRVDLSRNQVETEEIDADITKLTIGGTGIEARILYEEVLAGIEWSDPENKLIWFTGPLAGTSVAGGGTVSIATKGPMTNMAGISQANGYFGAFLRKSGLHGMVIQGAAKEWSRIHIHDGTAEILDARDLVGLSSAQTEEAIRAKTEKRCSIFTIGVAGENLVRFAGIFGDQGHTAAHNGLGAVMGSKKLKAVSVERGEMDVPVAHPKRLKEASQALFDAAVAADPNLGTDGTAFAFEVLTPMGAIPIKNYNTNEFPEYEKFTGKYLRSHFKTKPTPCWACRMGHCSHMEVTEGPYKGVQGEEPEYEALAAMGPLIYQKDPGAAVMLSILVDDLGMDVNESGYVIAWIMECYEKGLLTRDDLDGIEMNWGDPEATAGMLKKIANREGCGARFADGVKHAAEAMGAEALECAIFTKKGASPRGHDHRGIWMELIDTCVSNTGTIETGGPLAKPNVLGVTPPKDRFDPIGASKLNAQLNGGRQFEDCLGTCRFLTTDFQLTVDCLNAVTGWEYTITDAMEAGLRAINQLRVFNFRHGLTKEVEAPSVRYSSTPVNGPAKGIGIADHWEMIRSNYYKEMGWDPETGKPLPDTLNRLGLSDLIKDL
jgi:aldehyde:ferredoxin oxidoreductase